MTVMDKLKFWRKHEEPEIPEPQMPSMEPGATPPGMDQQAGGMPPGMEHLGMPPSGPGINEPPAAPPEQHVPTAFAQLEQPAQQGMSTEQQLQLISSKLDTIKAQLETILQRLDRLERKEQPRWPTNI